MRVWSNRSTSTSEYVEVLLVRAALMVHRQPVDGFSVSTNVFSRKSEYDGLVDAKKKTLSLTEAESFAKKLADDFGLVEDGDLVHRQRLWAVVK